MPRTYKRKIGCRKYADYTSEQVEKALKKIIDYEWPINKAAKEYKIPFGTLYNRYKGLHIKKSGGQAVFTDNEEKAIIRSAVTCSDWRFPLNMTDIQLITKNFLERQGRNEMRFKNNVPGIDWVQSLLKRHANLITPRLAANIKRVRANISLEIINE